MRTHPTATELCEALERIRAMPCCACWPADVDDVLADQVRAALLRLEARRPAGAAARPPATRWRPPRRRAISTAIDLKRAASGERDD